MAAGTVKTTSVPAAVSGGTRSGPASLGWFSSTVTAGAPSPVPASRTRSPESALGWPRGGTTSAISG